ncbi:hypothetical protein QJS10_CPA01g02204 [Acorus calamus]|uniref:Uncharacterized protein n=1 Tax=Acorus calamus TaxID=4465 RepID=A0AAV9FHJ3_ACOCL|nr:hypothetical protein QJS10_CPA01g02204 [Acorus calamus]
MLDSPLIHRRTALSAQPCSLGSRCSVNSDLSAWLSLPGPRRDCPTPLDLPPDLITRRVVGALPWVGP